MRPLGDKFSVPKKHFIVFTFLSWLFRFCRDIALHGHATGPTNIFIFRRLRRQRRHTWRQSSSHNKQPFWVHRIVTGSGLLPPSWSAPRYLRYIVFNFCPCIGQSDWYFGRITRDRAQLEYARFLKQSAVHFYHLLKTLVGGHQFTLSLASFFPPLPYRMNESL